MYFSLKISPVRSFASVAGKTESDASTFLLVYIVKYIVMLSCIFSSQIYCIVYIYLFSASHRVSQTEALVYQLLSSLLVFSVTIVQFLKIAFI